SGKADEITGTTLQTYTDYILNAAKQSSGYSLLSYESTTIGGQPANKIVYTATVPQRIGTTTQNAQIKTMQYLVVHNGKQYVVAYKTVQDDYDKYLTQAQEVINSFKFTS
ncbi:MAG: PsbP-related protein, partial [Halobacteriota archaeon]